MVEEPTENGFIFYDQPGTPPESIQVEPSTELDPLHDAQGTRGGPSPTKLTRRSVLKFGSIGLAAAGLGYGISSITRGVAGQTPPLTIGSSKSSAKILVVLTLYGGNDGLSTVIPYSDSNYQSMRPALAYSESEVHQLGDGLGLNPSLKNFATFWSQKRLAIVRGVGYPNPSFSHFQAMDIYQSGNPTTSVGTGWIGRWLDTAGTDPATSISIGPLLPPMLRGQQRTGAAYQPGGGLQLANGQLVSSYLSLEAKNPALTPIAQEVGSTSSDMVNVYKRIDSAIASSHPAVAAPPSNLRAGNSVDSELGSIATMINSDLGTRVYAASLASFDTHADEKGPQAALLAQLDTAVGNFFSSISTGPAKDEVVMLIYSEFGRRVAANASGGTDHGSAQPLFVIGEPVKGGFYGEEPSLSKLNDGNLVYNVDFRAVYSTVLESVLQSDSKPIIGSSFKNLGFLS